MLWPQLRRVSRHCTEQQLISDRKLERFCSLGYSKACPDLCGIDHATRQAQLRGTLDSDSRAYSVCSDEAWRGVEDRAATCRLTKQGCGWCFWGNEVLCREGLLYGHWHRWHDRWHHDVLLLRWPPGWQLPVLDWGNMLPLRRPPPV